MGNDRKPRVIGVIRLSTQEQASEGKAGILRQRNDIENASRIHNLEVVRTIEVIESGTKVRQQADFQQVFRDLARVDIDGVVCSNLDRLVRPDNFEDLVVFDYFRKNGKRIFTPGEIVDPQTQNGFLVSGFRGLLAGLERQLIVSRTADGREELRKKGEHPGGSHILPRGVRFTVPRDVNRKRTGVGVWSYDALESAKVLAAYDMLFAGDSFRSMAAKLGWDMKTIRTTLANPLWYGVREYSPSMTRKEPMQRSVLAETPLISRERWEAAQVLLRKRKSEWGARRKAPAFLLSGFLRCACGKRFYAHPAGTTRAYYRCASQFAAYRPFCGNESIKRDALDAAIERVIEERLTDTPFVVSLIEASLRTAEVQKPDTGKLERGLASIDAKRVRVLDLFVDGEIDKTERAKRLRALDQQAEEIRNLMPEKGASPTDPRRIAELLAKGFARFALRPFDEKRVAMQAAFREFVVENGGITQVSINTSALDIASVKVRERSQLWL